MAILQQGAWTAEFLISEAHGYRSREKGVIAAAAAALPPGQVLGKITSGGKLVAFAAGASDGSQTAMGILYGAAPDLAADQACTYIARDAEVSRGDLTGLTTAAEASLLALGIIVRND